MLMLYAAVLLGSSAVFARLLYVGSRVDRCPWWAGEGLVAYVWLPAVIGMLAFGVGFALQGMIDWEAQIFGLREGAVVAGIAAGALVLWQVIGRALPPRDGEPTLRTPAAAAPVELPERVDPDAPTEPARKVA